MSCQHEGALALCMGDLSVNLAVLAVVVSGSCGLHAMHARSEVCGSAVWWLGLRACVELAIELRAYAPP